MPSIIFITRSFPQLSESFLFNKAVYLRSKGYDITVLTQTKGNDAKFFPKDILSNIKIIPSPPVNNILVALVMFLKYIIKHPFKIQRVLNSLSGNTKINKIKLAYRYLPFIHEKFDIVYFPFSGLSIPYMPLFPLLKKNALIYVSCRGSAEKIRPVIDPGRKLELEKLFQVVDRVHCVSEEMQETCIKMGLSPAKSFVNRPAINPDLFRHENEKTIGSPIKLITVGRLHWVKYHDFLLLALSEYQKQGGQFCLSIVGNGTEYDRLLFLSNKLGLMHSVKFLGPKPAEEVRKLLAENDIYIQTSISEGISNSVIEAMAMSLPVICTDVGGMKELIDDGVDGYLIPLFNSEILVQRLNELANNTSKRSEVGRKARNKILKEFTLDKQCQIFIDEYSKQLKVSKQNFAA